MTEQLTKKDLQRILLYLNAWSDPEDEDETQLRQKVEKMIAEYPATTEETIGGHRVTVERIG